MHGIVLQARAMMVLAVLVVVRRLVLLCWALVHLLGLVQSDQASVALRMRRNEHAEVGM